MSMTQTILVRVTVVNGDIYHHSDDFLEKVLKFANISEENIQLNRVISRRADMSHGYYIINKDSYIDMLIKETSESYFGRILDATNGTYIMDNGNISCTLIARI
jgi:hypothetical protein